MVKLKRKIKIGIAIVSILAIIAFAFFVSQPFAITGGAGHTGRIYNQFGQGSFDLLPESGQVVTRGNMVTATLFLDCGNCGGTVFPTNNPNTLTLKDENGQVLGETIRYDKGTDRNQGGNGYWPFTFNSSKLSAGSHILYVETSGNPSIDSAKLISIILAADYRSVPTWGQNPLAYLEIFVQPAVCDVGEGNAEVSRVVTSGKTFSKDTFTDYPVVKVCDVATRVLRADILTSSDDFAITSNFGLGLQQTVPPSQVWEIKYITKKTWTTQCTTSAPFSADLKDCAGTGFIRPCGETGVLLKTGTCYEIPVDNCKQGTIYNASITQEGCIYDIAPKGNGWSSQWESAIQAYAVQIPLTKVCEGNSPSATYQAPKTTDEKGMCLMPDNSLRLPLYDCSPYTGSFPAMKDEIYYCQFGAEQLKDCPYTLTDGACIEKELQIVDKVIVDEKIIEREVPFEVIVEKQVGVPFKYVAVIIAIAAIIILALLYVFRWRR